MSGVEHSIPDANDDPAIAVIVISVSAGGLAPLRSLIGSLPQHLPAAVVIAQHAHERSFLPEILAADTQVPVAFAQSGGVLRAGTIYVCPAERHVIVNPDGTCDLSKREPLNFFRPSGDWLFATAAASFRERAFAVVLSGLQNDGAAGVVAIRRAGGMVFAQEPSTCGCPAMPAAAIATGSVDFVLSPDQIARVLAQHLMQLDVQRCKAEWNAPFTDGAPAGVPS
jgi:two-component system chemotaxis response regulator CheB